MEYRLIADSCCDVSKEMVKEMNIDIVPFKLNIDGTNYVDDELLDVQEFREHMYKSKNPVKSACPSPGDYLKYYKDSDRIFVVTISSKLSGSYNSAVLAKEMALEENPNMFIHVFDSKSASTGNILAMLKVKECLDKGLSNDEIVETVEAYIDEINTMFILQNFDNLVKNGRMSKVKGMIASALKFTPIMQGVDGEIELFENIRGTKKSLNRLSEAVGELGKNLENEIFVITHTNALDKAQYLRDKINDMYKFKDILVLETRGLSSSYAYKGGIIVGY